MALSNYTELQAAVRTEISVDISGITDPAIVDAIARAEAKVNRRTRLREAEQLATATYAAGTTAIEDRLLALPTGMKEMLNLRIKKVSETDDNYVQCQFLSPRLIADKYSTSSTGTMYYTLRDQLEFSHPVAEDHEVMMHYLKRWDIATDSTNWLLTNYPDVYLYGACGECELHLHQDERVPIWKSLFEQALNELNRLDSRSRDDTILDTSEVAGMSSCRAGYNILTG